MDYAATTPVEGFGFCFETPAVRALQRRAPACALGGEIRLRRSRAFATCESCFKTESSAVEI